jgi:phage terminase small subunit
MATRRESRGLNPKQRAFVRQYLIDHDATNAARRAGYSVKNADVVGPRLLGHVGVAAAIEKAEARLAAQLEMTALDVRRELAIIGRSNVADYRIDERGNVALAPGVSPDVLRAVSRIKRKVRHLAGGGMEYETELTLWN